ncbi:uncharacterized protein LOC105828422 isoform X2 [Monomorium pharaonis]|uniref:uncharacterized protein LOC105828422 isoform X2 n=1 Tax=Monomorium pharaonis TaxID=307658 RepID=UPI00174647AF|nr:uncharacterized protein LOC105828422 isoform X2 [Monomorium pharaonis]
MEGETYWPPHNVEAESLVRKEVNANKNWPKYRVHIKRYHDEYIKARNNVKGITKHDDSNYKTEKELGRGMRKKTNKILSSTSSSDSDEQKRVKKSTKSVATPPNVQPPLHCNFYGSVPSYSHFNESQKKKKLNIKVDAHKSQRIQKQQASLNCSSIKRKAVLVQNVLDARKRAAGQI